jgi:hypothetical protein
MLSCLLERNGRFSSFNDESREDTLETFYGHDKEDYEMEDDNANNKEDSDDDYHEGGCEEIEEESSH